CICYLLSGPTSRPRADHCQRLPDTIGRKDNIFAVVLPKFPVNVECERRNPLAQFRHISSSRANALTLMRAQTATISHTPSLRVIPSSYLPVFQDVRVRRNVPLRYNQRSQK